MIKKRDAIDQQISSSISTEDGRARSKKHKTMNSSDDVFADSLRIGGVWQEYKKEYEKAAPYPHIKLEPLCNEALFESVRDEIVGNLRTKYKETDLFKLYQTTDLANIDSSQPELSRKLPSLLKLRDALYSKKFREFVSRVTGCPTLTDRVDMAASAYSDGCHLLCHDDVIGTRAVSYIIYFVEPEWTAEDGGALELYPLVPSSVVINSDSNLPQGLPAANPATKLVPAWNSMAMFNVQPGRSYHSVEEVHRKNCTSPRLSIQGWYHAPTAPKGAEMASINQLKTLARLNATALRTQAESNQRNNMMGQSWELSNSDVSFLKEYINPIYLEKGAIDKISDKYINNSYVELRNFLNAKTATEIASKLFSGECDVLKDDNWKLQGPAHVNRFLQYCPKNSGNTKNELQQRFILDHIDSNVFNSISFRKFIHVLTGESKPTNSDNRSIVRCFRKGNDYTVAHHGLLLPSGDTRLDCNLCFVDDGSFRSKSQQTSDLTGGTEAHDNAIEWESGERGGFECYIAADNEENEAAEVYKDDDEDEDGGIVLSISPTFNTLTLTLRDDGTMRFIKYVSSNAPSNRFDIATSYCVEYSDDEDETTE